MSNPFSHWTAEMVEQHNAKVRKNSPPASTIGGEDDAEHDHIEAVTCTSKRKPKRIRQSDKPKLNRLESEFQHHLQGCDAFPQVVRFELSTGLHYTPDFFSFKMMTAWEVKGPKSWEDSLIKLRMAAKVWTDIKWVLAWKEDGEWQTQEILP